MSGVSLLALLVPELWARDQERGWTIRLDPEEPGRKYALVPAEGMINAAGFRERDFPKAKPAGELRVAVVGDSVTFGGGLSDEQIATRVAERILRDQGRELRVLNFAVHGYDVEQVAATVRWRVWDYQPDIVVYAAYVNDAVPTSVMSLDDDGTPVYVGDEPVTGLLAGAPGEWLQIHSALFRRYRGAVVSREIAAEGDSKVGFDADFFDAHLAELREDAASREVPLLVWGLAPHVMATADNASCWPQGHMPGFCAIHEVLYIRLRQEVERMGVPYWSGLDALRASGQPSFPQMDSDPHHPNAAGHAVLGADLAEMIAAWMDGEVERFFSGRSRRALHLLQRGRGQ